MKLRSVTKLGKRNIAVSRKKTMTANCDVIVLFICRQFAAKRKPDFGYMVYKGSLTMTLYLTKNEIRNKITLTCSFNTVALSKGTIFVKKY